MAKKLKPIPKAVQDWLDTIWETPELNSHEESKAVCVNGHTAIDTVFRRYIDGIGNVEQAVDVLYYMTKYPYCKQCGNSLQFQKYQQESYRSGSYDIWEYAEQRSEYELERLREERDQSKQA